MKSLLVMRMSHIYYNDGASECGTASWSADCSDGSDEPCFGKMMIIGGEPSDCEATVVTVVVELEEEVSWSISDLKEVLRRSTLMGV